MPKRTNIKEASTKEASTKEASTKEASTKGDSTKGDSIMKDIIAGDLVVGNLVVRDLVVKDLVIKEEEPICIICQDPFLENEPTKVVHTTAYEHKFHTQCIDSWCQECFKNRKRPTCPLCPSYKIPLSICPKPEEEEEEEEEEFISQFHETAFRRLCNIPYNMSYNERFRIPIFMGIMVFINGKYILKYSNRHLNLNLSSTLREIKDKILAKRDRIYEASRLSQANLRHNMVIDNWVQWKYPEVRITDVHFGIPPYRQKIGLFNEPLDDDSMLADLYERYQILAGEMVWDRSIPSDALEQLDVIYSNRVCLYQSGPTGPDDRTHYEYGYCNPENPHDSNAYGVDSATNNSMAWIAVHVTYA
jgi:hypothetical protein